MTLQTTNTFDGADSWSVVPSKIRTFSKITPASWGAWADTCCANVHPRTSNPRSTDLEVSLMSVLVLERHGTAQLSVAPCALT